MRFLAILLALWPGAAAAHVSERGLVLLLPTDVWVPAGVAAVAATALLLFLVPGRAVAAAFRPLRLGGPLPGVGPVPSLLSLALLAALLWTGVAGPRDPLANPLSLAIWTVWWIVLPLAQAVLGDLWAAINPWSGLHRLIFGDRPPPLRLPDWLGQAPAIPGYVLFAAFLLADPAPDDPARLARAVAGYWLVTFAAMSLFGRAWLARGEGFSIWLGHLARLAPVWSGPGGTFAGLPGARLLQSPSVGVAGGVFLMVVLAAGSFDGLNETFWWLALIGVNPLEFPGRSAVQSETLAGLFAAMAGLVLAFGAVVWLGLAMVGQAGKVRAVFGRLALSLVPIALGYHVAHYLTVLLVNGQYALAAASDPMATGADLLGLGTFYVTTSFFNSTDTVRAIWLAQGGAIVLGHVLAVLMAHALTREALGGDRRAALAHAPVAAFMTAYTWLGLWILSSPTG